MKPSADSNLATENFPGLNQTFYSMSPHGYLRRRLKALLLWHGDPPGLDDLLSEKFLVENMAITLGADEEEEEKAERERFVVLEAEVLLHHVSETLLRLYLVHAQGAKCPWLDLSRDTNFAVFKKGVGKLRKRLESREEFPRIQTVFFTTTERETLTPTPDQETWEVASQNIADFMDYYAAHFLDSAPYNAAKHGLALLAGQAGIQVGAGQDPEPFLARSGPALEYLTIERNQASGNPRWTQVTKWIVLRRALAMIQIGCSLVEAIWKVGSGKRIAKKPDSISLFNEPVFAEVMKRTEHPAEGSIPGITMDRISEPLLYYETSAKGGKR